MGGLRAPLGEITRGQGLQTASVMSLEWEQPPTASQQCVGGRGSTGLGTGWVLSVSSRPKSEIPFSDTTSDQQLLSLEHLLDARPSGTAALTDGKAGSGGGDAQEVGSG